MAKFDACLNIKVNKQPLSADDLQDLIELTVDSDYYLPTMFEFTLEDDFNRLHTALGHIDGNKFTIGALVSISVDASLEVEKENLKGTLVDGEITSIEPEFGPDGRSRLRVRGYDRAHRLMAGEKIRVFGNGSSKMASASDIFSTVAQEARLRCQASSELSSIQYSYVLQNAQTDWDFLWERARQIGYQVYVRDQTLYCCKANQAREGAARSVSLEWTKDLTSFEPRLSVVGQAAESTVLGWDVQTKQKVIGQAKNATLSTQAKLGGGTDGDRLVDKLYPRTKLVTLANLDVDHGLASKMADAELSICESNMIQGSGFLQYGDPRVLAGVEVKITGVGKVFSSTYYVTHARHTFTQGRYGVDFEVSETGPHTLSGMLQSGAKTEHAQKIDGIVVGIVTNINDPNKLGRVQVKYPWLPNNPQGSEFSSNWARVASAGAGKERGILFLPEINDEVLVAFDHGDMTSPYILGGLWNKTDTPPDGKDAQLGDNQFVNQRVIRSRTGHLILLMDKAGEEQILIQDKSKENSILIDTAKNAITLKSKADFTIEAGGNFTVKAQGDVKFEATGKYEVSKIKSFSVTALQEAILKSSNNQLAIKAGGAELSGLMVDIKGSTKVSVSSSALAEIKGGLVKIN